MNFAIPIRTTMVMGMLLILSNSLAFGQSRDHSPTGLPLTAVTAHQLTVVEGSGAVRTREYFLYRPSHVPADAPLVIVMHGGSLQAEHMLRHSGDLWARLADERGFLVAFPQGRPRGAPSARAQRYWNDCQRTGPSARRHTDWDDVAFIATLIDEVYANHGINKEQVFATGVSNGGNMAIRLAFELDDRVAGFAPSITYGPPIDDIDLNECRTRPSRQRPMLLTYGTHDRLNPPEGSGGCRDGNCADGSSQSVSAFTDFWSEWLGVTSVISRDVPDRIQGDGPRACETPRSSTQTRLIMRRDDETVMEVRRINCGGHAEPGERQFSWRSRLIVGWRNLDAPAPTYIADFWGL